MKKLVFRFDIDTHKCIRDGVPNLLALAKEFQSGFSFFLNPGKAVSITESLKETIFRTKRDKQAECMSAMQKLGLADYAAAAVINPRLTKYKSIIRNLHDSCSELGIHGGRNHALWHKHAGEWEEPRVRNEISWALKKMRDVIPEYQPKGFASPGWTSPVQLEKVLADFGFLYCADFRCGGGQNVLRKGKRLPYIGVNLLGEPQGVAFFESCRVKGCQEQDILDMVLRSIDRNEVTVIYDHPYYAGIKELACIRKIMEQVKERKDAEIVTLEKLL